MKRLVYQTCGDIDRQIDESIGGRQAGIYVDRQTPKRARQTERKVGRQSGRHTHRQAGRQIHTDKQTDKQTDGCRVPH